MQAFELDKYLKKLLTPEKHEYSDTYLNGWQIRGAGKISKIALGVDASLEFFKHAHSWGANTMIVHHGLNFGAVENSVPDLILHNRLQYLFSHNLNLFGFHFLLDAHPGLGNNAQILKYLGLNPEKPFGEYNYDYWGFSSTFKQAQKYGGLLQRLNQLFSNNAHDYHFGKDLIKTIAVVSGGGSITIAELKEKDIDLLVTGEVNENTQEACRELQINLIYGGHYLTETFGVKALTENLKQELKIPVRYFEIINLT